MTGKEKKVVKQRVLAKEKLRQFYSSYKFHIGESIKFVDNEVRGRINEIEHLFSLGQDSHNRDARRKRFEIPFSICTYMEFKEVSKTLMYYSNKDLKRSLKEVKTIHERQSFRNTEVFRMLRGQVEWYIHCLKHNYHLKSLCQIKNQVGEQAKKFRKQRMAEAYVLLDECKQLITIARKDMFINNLDDYLKTYTDFFVQCQFRLDKFLEKANITMFEQKEIIHKEDLTKQKKGEKISLELPGWTMASKFE